MVLSTVQRTSANMGQGHTTVNKVLSSQRDSHHNPLSEFYWGFGFKLKKNVIHFLALIRTYTWILFQCFTANHYLHVNNNKRVINRFNQIIRGWYQTLCHSQDRNSLTEGIIFLNSSHFQFDLSPHIYIMNSITKYIYH